MSIIEKLIERVVKLIDKTGSEEEKALAHELVDSVIPKKTKFENIFFVKDKETHFKTPNGKEYITTCKEKKANKYIGCAVVYGYYDFGSKTQFNKYLKQFYGCNEKDIEKYALIHAYTKFGGREKFESYIDERFRPKEKKQ